MSTPEGKVKAALVRMLKAEGVWSYSPQAGPYGVAGIPDRILIVCGQFVGVECKANAKAKLTALQEKCRDEIIHHGGQCFRVHDAVGIERLREWIVDARSRRQKIAWLEGSKLGPDHVSNTNSKSAG